MSEDIPISVYFVFKIRTTLGGLQKSCHGQRQASVKIDVLVVKLGVLVCATEMDFEVGCTSIVENQQRWPRQRHQRPS